ncbi:hypothetical protein [Cupriavidus sp. 2SB]|uniref:hypothetical protein n=1 Tax=Cupriavidus sp. 2SB TaxID=2502199 RepID=UPI0010F84B99|nr:hypothetical protein [Cupriavidus sp. 2SB]
MNRDDLLFGIRYSARLMERQGRFWKKVDGTIRLCSLLSGMAALSFLMKEGTTTATVFGLFFAFCQAIEYGLQPSEKAAKAGTQRRRFTDLLGRAPGLSDLELSAAFHSLPADEEVPAIESLRAVAYNDVLDERGDDPTHKMPLTFPNRLFAVIG